MREGGGERGAGDRGQTQNVQSLFLPTVSSVQKTGHRNKQTKLQGKGKLTDLPTHGAAMTHPLPWGQHLLAQRRITVGSQQTSYDQLNNINSALGTATLQ